MVSRRRALPVVVWLLLVVSAASLLAAHVRPTLFWPLAVAAVFLPATSLLLLVFSVAAAFRRMRIPVGLAAVFLLVFVFRHVSPARWSQPGPGTGDFTVMTYNAPRHPDDDRARRQVIELVSEARPDVIALQETVVWSMRDRPDILHAHEKFRPLVDSMGYRSAMPPQGGGDFYRYTHWRPPVLTKIEPVRQSQIDIGEMENGISEHSVLRTELEWDGRPLAIYNVHLPSHGSSKPWKRGRLFSIAAWLDYVVEIRDGFHEREQHVKMIRDLLENEPLPTVLTGDFNGTPDSWTYRQLSRGLTDVYREAGSGWGATYHADRPAVRIDFVLVGPEFEPVDAFVPDRYPYSSDHRPLVVRFRWRQKQSHD